MIYLLTLYTFRCKNIYLVYSLSIIIFGGLGFFLTWLLTCGTVVLILEYRTTLSVYELGLFRILSLD